MSLAPHSDSRLALGETFGDVRTELTELDDSMPALRIRGVSLLGLKGLEAELVVRHRDRAIAPCSVHCRQHRWRHY